MTRPLGFDVKPATRHCPWEDHTLTHPAVAGHGVTLRYRPPMPPGGTIRKPQPARPATVAVIHHLGGPHPVADPAYFELLAHECLRAAEWLRCHNTPPAEPAPDGQLVLTEGAV